MKLEEEESFFRKYFDEMKEKAKKSTLHKKMKDKVEEIRGEVSGVRDKGWDGNAYEVYSKFRKYKYYQPKFQTNPTLVLLCITLSTLLFISCLFLGSFFARQKANAFAFQQTTTKFASLLFFSHFPSLVIFMVMLDRAMHIWNERVSSLSNFIEVLFYLYIALFNLTIFGNVFLTWFREMVQGPKERNYTEKQSQLSVETTLLEVLGLQAIKKMICESETLKKSIIVFLTGLGSIIGAGAGAGGAAAGAGAGGTLGGYVSDYFTPICNFTSELSVCFVFTGENKTENKTIPYSEAFEYSGAHNMISSLVNYSFKKGWISDTAEGVAKCIYLKYVLLLTGLLPAASLYDWALDEKKLPVEHRRISFKDDKLRAVQNLLFKNGVACSREDFDDLLGQADGKGRYIKKWKNTLGLIFLNDGKPKPSIPMTPALNLLEPVQQPKSRPENPFEFEPKSPNPQRPGGLKIALKKIDTAKPDFKNVVALEQSLKDNQVVAWPTYEFVRANRDVLNEVFDTTSLNTGRKGALTKTDFKQFVKKKGKLSELQNLYQKEEVKVNYDLRTLPLCAFAAFKPTHDLAEIEVSKSGEVFKLDPLN